MKVLLTGGNGMLGSAVIEVMKNRGIPFYAPSSETMDITNIKQVYETIINYQPDIIIHCAAYTNVDQAETDKRKCIDVNVYGTQYLCEAARAIDAKFIFISSDYVFDGTQPEYSVSDNCYPLSVYGFSKRLAELIVERYKKSFIIRTSWLFGKNGKNYVDTMLRLAETRNELNVVNDEIGSPTYVPDLAAAILAVAASSDFGYHHIHNTGYCSRADFTKYILKDKDIKINEISTEEYYQGRLHAERPLNNILVRDNQYILPDWMDAVDRYLERK